MEATATDTLGDTHEAAEKHHVTEALSD
jgi:hypothetical protein